MARSKEILPDLDAQNEYIEHEIEIDGKTTPEDGRPLYDGVTNFAYIGASLPDGRLKSNTVLCGSHADIMDYYKEEIARYPGVDRLFVPVARLADARQKIGVGGNLLNQRNNDIAAAIKAEAEKKSKGDGK